jgi:hypothetical protein
MEDTHEHFRSYQARYLRRGACVADFRDSGGVLAGLDRTDDSTVIHAHRFDRRIVRPASDTYFAGSGLRRLGTDLWHRRECAIAVRARFRTCRRRVHSERGSQDIRGEGLAAFDRRPHEVAWNGREP